MENNAEVRFCSKCGQQNLLSDNFCKSCGNKLKSIEDSIKDVATNIEDSIKDVATNIKDTVINNENYKKFTEVSDDSYLKADWQNDNMIKFIQKNTQYYILKFKEMQEMHKDTSWNWPAFFFGGNWLLYRKMYAYGAMALVANFILSFIPILGWLLNLGMCVLFGLYGNKLYLKNIQKELLLVKEVKQDIRDRIILSKGGTNLVLPILIPIVVFILSIIFGVVVLMSDPYYYYY